MKKLTKLLLASALALSIAPVVLLGLSKSNEQELTQVKAEETPDGTMARPYKIASYEDLRLMNNAPTNGTPTYYSLSESWIYNERLNGNNISINCPGSDVEKVIWLDLNGKTILKEGRSTDTYYFYISGHVQMYIYDSHNGSGEIQMWLDNWSNDSCIFYVSAGATLNIISGKYTYLFEYSNSVYGGGSQFSHEGNIFRVFGTGKVNIYDGVFNAADYVVKAETASQVTIHSARFTNLRTYDVYANRQLILLTGENEKYSDMLYTGTTISPTPESQTDSILWGAETFTFRLANSSTIYTNIASSSSQEITINQGEEYIFTSWVSGTHTYKWLFYPSTITVNNHPALELLGDNILRIKPTLANGSLDDSYLTLSFHYYKSGQEKVREVMIHINVTKTHYAVTFDMQGNGNNVIANYPIGGEATIGYAIQTSGIENYYENYYLLGFAPKPLGEYSGTAAFIEAANALYDDTTVISEDMTLYAGWAKFKDDTYDFSAFGVKELELTTEKQSLGSIYFYNLPLLSKMYTHYYRFKLWVEASSFHVASSESDTLPISFFYKIGDDEIKSTDSGIIMINQGNSKTEEVEIFVQLTDLTNRITDKVYLSEISYQANIYDNEHSGVDTFSSGAISNIYLPADVPAPVTLSSISLSGTHKTTFRLGDEFSYEGLVVTANYSNGTSHEVTGYTVSTPDMTSEGTKDVTVSFTDGEVTKTATYQIVVVPAEVPVVLESISLSGTYKTEFHVGDTFSYEGLVVTAHYDGKEDAVITDYSISTPDMSTAGTKTVTVSYTEDGITKTATYTITVLDKEEPPVDESETDVSEPVESEGSSSEQQPAKKKGCGGSILTTSAILSLLAISGSVILISKKRKED